jgi:hypothetical protein
MAEVGVMAYVLRYPASFSGLRTEGWLVGAQRTNVWWVTTECYLGGNYTLKRPHQSRVAPER